MGNVSQDSHDRNCPSSNNSSNYDTINQKKIIIYHQNIRGIINKADELLLSFTSELPHIICLSEHHLKEYEISSILLEQYVLANKYCRKNFKQGGVCIYVRENIQFKKINNIVNCKEKDLEMCGINVDSINMCIVCIYRAPIGDFNYFLENLNKFLNKLYKNSRNIVICGDININYLANTNYKQQLDSLLASYGLHSIVTFPTRTCYSSSTAIDNIFINKYKNKNYTVYPWINGLSDHDGQTITIHNVKHKIMQNQTYTRRIVNETSLLNFQINLSYEVWDDIFIDDDVDIIFNKFLNTYIRIFNSCFQTAKLRRESIYKLWITPRIKKSCSTKRELYTKTKDSNDPRVREHYRIYCKILSRSISAAKRLYLSKIIEF